MSPLRRPQSQRIGERVENGVGWEDAPLLDTAQVVRAHPGEHSDLFPSEPGHATQRVGRDADVVRLDGVPAGAHEGA